METTVETITITRKKSKRGYFVMAALGLLTIGFIGLELGMDAFAMGLIMATAPVPIYIGLALWLDRYEAEPTNLLAWSFFWGATVSAFVSIIVNSTVGATAGEIAMMTISAPIIEEATKGAVLFLLFYRYKDEFDNILDGIVYASMVGLGFAMTENILYYGNALLQGSDVPKWTFIIRGMASPFAHPLFTAMTGIGLGLARQTDSRALKSLAPIGGLLLAMGLHAAWNLSASTDSLGVFVTVYVLFMVPVFIGILVIVAQSLKRERKVIADFLKHDLDQGLLTREDYDCLCRSSARTKMVWRSLTRGGMEQWRARREFHQLTSELAFHRWRVSRNITLGPELDAQRETGYVEQIRVVRERISVN